MCWDWARLKVYYYMGGHKCNCPGVMCSKHIPMPQAPYPTVLYQNTVLKLCYYPPTILRRDDAMLMGEGC